MDKPQDILQAGIDGITDRARFRDADGRMSMDKTVAIFNLLKDNDLSVRDGWDFMKIVKMVRAEQGEFHLDDYVDEAAYCALAGSSHYGEVRPSRKGPSVCEDLPEDEGDVHGPGIYNDRTRPGASLDLYGVSGKETKENDK